MLCFEYSEVVGPKSVGIRTFGGHGTGLTLGFKKLLTKATWRDALEQASLQFPRCIGLGPSVRDGTFTQPRPFGWYLSWVWSQTSQRYLVSSRPECLISKQARPSSSEIGSGRRTDRITPHLIIPGQRPWNPRTALTFWKSRFPLFGSHGQCGTQSTRET